MSEMQHEGMGMTSEDIEGPESIEANQGKVEAAHKSWLEKAKYNIAGYGGLAATASFRLPALYELADTLAGASQHDLNRTMEGFSKFVILTLGAEIVKDLVRKYSDMYKDMDKKRERSGQMTNVLDIRLSKGSIGS